MTISYRLDLDPNTNACGNAVLSNVHLLCACCDPGEKLVKRLQEGLRKCSWKAVEKAFLGDAEFKLCKKRLTDIDARLVTDVENNAGCRSVKSDGDAGEVKEEGTGKTSLFLAGNVGG